MNCTLFSVVFTDIRLHGDSLFMSILLLAVADVAVLLTFQRTILPLFSGLK
jgi:hypothetical protein